MYYTENSKSWSIFEDFEKVPWFTRVRSQKIKIRGFSMRRAIFGRAISLFIMTPSSTMESSIEPPGIFSAFVNRLMSISVRPSGVGLCARPWWLCHMREPSNGWMSSKIGSKLAGWSKLTAITSNDFRTVHFVPEVFLSSGHNLTSWSYDKEKLLQILVLPRIITEVVPSPHSSS